jgi:Flavodoxin-like fold
MSADETVTTTRRATLLLIGSPKPGRSTSLSLGTGLAERLTARGCSVETMGLVKALKTEEATQALLEQLDTAELVILAAPLYVDSLPALVIKAFERYSAHQSLLQAAAGSETHATGVPGTRRFVALVNCGFPEAEQCTTALAICRLFARDVGFVWSGGLAFGMGGSVDGRPIERGPLARTAVPALDRTAEALARGASIPQEAVALAAKRSMPLPVYRFAGNVNWRFQARGKTGGRSLKHRPHADVESHI